MDKIEKSILRTISWFDIFNYPLTAWEIYKWGYIEKSNIKYRISNIKETLENSGRLKELISHKDGFYFLRWQDGNIEKRKERYLLAEKKYRKLLKIAKFLAPIPFTRVITVATGLSYLNSREEDDIDLFIITAQNRIWLVRFFSILVLKIFRARPTIANKKDKICLNFFVTEENLNLKKICLPEKDDLPDIYFIYWLTWLYPIYQEKKVWQKFVSENFWIKDYLPFYIPQQPIKSRQIFLSSLAKIIKSILEIFFSPIYWQSIFSFLQRAILPYHLKKLANKDSSVIIKNSILKFHNKDKRQEYRQKFYEKIK